MPSCLSLRLRPRVSLSVFRHGRMALAVKRRLFLEKALVLLLMVTSHMQDGNICNRRYPMFENYRVFETTLAGRPLVVETGKLAQLASGACLVRYGETVLLCTVTASDKPREGVDPVGGL